MMLESKVEDKLQVLKGWGFEVLKLTTPGYNGTKDRLILAPRWSPAPPAFVELKRPGKVERALQAAVRDDWRARGCDVRDMCDTPEKVGALCDRLLIEAVDRFYTVATGILNVLPQHIQDAYRAACYRVDNAI